MIVAKFGGTSVKDANALNALSGIAKKNDGIRVVVVSAVAGVTQLLLDASDPKAGLNRNNVVDAIVEIHRTILKNLDYIEEISLRALLEQTFENFRHFSKKRISNSPRDRDHWLSFGEQLSSILVAIGLKKQGVAAKLLDVRHILKTDSEFNNANPLIDKLGLLAKEKLLPHLADSVVVLQGFIGQTVFGETTTMGRGCSDYSAALIAEAIDANFVYIYTDVNGVYTADPKITTEAKHFSRLSFDEMKSLANQGARILHPATLTPCARKNIPIYIASTFHSDMPGTLIEPVVENEPSLIEQENPVLVTL